MAEIKFYANLLGTDQQTLIQHTQNSGIGFYGANFGVSVPISQVQSTTFVTNATGTEQGVALNNTKYANDNDNRNQAPGKVIADNTGASSIELRYLPNNACPLNIRFTHTEAVRVQNCKLRIFDRNDINNNASGVVTYVYEARHPLLSTQQLNLSHRAKLQDTWTIFEETAPMADMPFTNSPGVSGLNTNSSQVFPAYDQYLSSIGVNIDNYKQGSSHRSLRHDWYVALSSEPITIGSKTQYGLYFSVEYL